jgi:hypothetical protein
MPLQTALAAETDLAEGLTLKLRCTVKAEKSLTDLVGMRRLTVSKTDEQLILPLKTLIRKIIIINIAWVDYQKAFDSVPHSWILFLWLYSPN